MNTMMTVLTLLAGRASQMYFTATLARQQVRGSPCFLYAAKALLASLLELPYSAVVLLITAMYWCM